MLDTRKNNCYVITGGPGVGKTSLLQELAKYKCKVVPEDAREIIKHEIDTGGDGLPWKNKIRYTYLMLDAAVRSYEAIPQNDSGIYFFDRGILDAICYATMIGLDVSTEMESICRNFLYNKKVFILPPWEEIYHADSERKQTWKEAAFTFRMMKATYIDYGYEIIEVPKDTVGNRAKFILHSINSHLNS